MESLEARIYGIYRSPKHLFTPFSRKANYTAGLTCRLNLFSVIHVANNA